MWSRFAIAGLLLLVVVPSSPAASQRHRRSGVSLRKRLNVNDLITEPGTVELEWGTLYSYSTAGWTMPSALKFTPEGASLFRGRTEYSISFDSLASDVNTGVRSTQFGDRLTFAATSVLFDSRYFDLAVAPQVTTFLRNESGVRLGGTMIARYDRAGNSVGLAVSWTAATAVTAGNPAGVWDFGAGYGRPLAATGLLGRITPHVNTLLEKSTEFQRTLAAFGGVEYQVSKRIAVDVSGQRLGLTGLGPDRQLLVSLTVNLGKLH